MTRKNIEQARASFAWNAESRSFKPIVDKIPTYIKTNGLLNTMAFLNSKTSEGRGEALHDICNWLVESQKDKSRYFLISRNDLSGNGKLEEQIMDYLMRTNPTFLIQCTAEVLALFNWLRRFAK